MPAILTTKFRHGLAKELLNSVSNTAYYATAGKPLSFTSDTTPPAPTDDVKSSHYDVYADMIFGKRIRPNDVRIMARRHDWTSGVVYQPYDHEATDLYSYEYKFFVVVDEGSFYSVFKCLDNNNGAPSTAKPSLYETSAIDQFYQTADGYQWKYLFSITRSEFEKFATVDYVPITANSQVTYHAANGALETIRVVDGGIRYNSYHAGSIQAARVGGDTLLYTIDPTAASNTDFYKNCVIKITSGPGAGQQRVISEYIVSGTARRVMLTQEFDAADLPNEDSTYEISPQVVVVGDGSGFEGRAIVNPTTNSISSVEITNRGEGYSWANVVVIANTGIVNSISNTVIVANTAVLRAVISPPGGHGSDVETELAGTHLGLSLTFNTTESGDRSVSTNDYRRVAIVRDPLFANVVIEVSNSTGTMTVGETVVQEDTNARGVVTVANTTSISMTRVSGSFETGNTIYGIVRGTSSNNTAQVSDANPENTANPGLYFDQTYTLQGNVVGVSTFLQDEMVYQGSHANGYLYFANNTTLKLTNVKGVFNTSETNTISGYVTGQTSTATADISYIKLPDVINASGEVLYIENVAPITRANGQTETIKVIVEF